MCLKNLYCNSRVEERNGIAYGTHMDRDRGVREMRIREKGAAGWGRTKEKNHYILIIYFSFLFFFFLFLRFTRPQFAKFFGNQFIDDLYIGSMNGYRGLIPDTNKHVIEVK